MHGVSKAVALPFTVTARNDRRRETTLGVTASVVLSRRDYGINFNRPDNPDFLGDQVEIELSLVTRAAGGQ